MGTVDPTMNRKWALGLVVVAVAGCGGSSSSPSVSPTAPRVRALNDILDATSVSVDVSGTKLLDKRPFSFASTYVAIAAGSKAVTFKDGPSGASLLAVPVTLENSKFYDAMGLGSVAKGIHVAFLTDDHVTVAGTTKVRVVNGLEDNASVDVYVTLPGTADLTGLTPNETGLAFADGASPYLSVTPGSYTVWITPAGVPGTLLVGNNETFADATNVTLIAVKTPSGLQIQEIGDQPAF